MITFDKDTLLYITALNSISKVQARDCLVTDTELIYVVDSDKVGQAVGREGSHAKKLGDIHKKAVRIIGFSADPVEFARNIIGKKQRISSIKLEETGTEKHIIIEADYNSHGSVRGKKDRNLKILKKLLYRHHNITDVILNNSITNTHT